MVYIFLLLTYFTWYGNLQTHPCCCRWNYLFYSILWPGGSSAGKESVCNEGDPYLIPGSGSSPGEGIGYPLQYFWVSLVVQMNAPAMLETWVRSLGWEHPLEEGMTTHSSILPWRIPMDRGAGVLQSMGSQAVEYD